MKNIKTRTKLYAGFISAIILTIIVGIVGYTNMSSIIYQLEISKIANRIIVDAEDAQAGSLRYIIYNNDAYYNTVNVETENIINEVIEINKLLLSEQNN